MFFKNVVRLEVITRLAKALESLLGQIGNCTFGQKTKR